MPHDRNGVKINAGDVVTMRFVVQSVDSAGSETGCNVTLVATGNPEGEYAPVLVCNTRLTVVE